MQERREEAESYPPIARRRDAGGVQQRRPHRALHPSPRTACAPCPSRRAVNAAGGGAGTEVEEGAGARRGAFVPLLQRETRRRQSPSASVM